MIAAEEQGLVQQLVPRPPVSGFHEAILHRLAGHDVVPVDGMILRLGEDHMRGELSAIVRAPIILGFPRCPIRVVSSRATRMREIEVSGIAAGIRSSRRRRC